MANMPALRFVEDTDYKAVLVFLTVGIGQKDFILRIKYSAQNGILLGIRYPKVVVDSSLQTLEFTMVEEGPADINITHVKIYSIVISDLINGIGWTTQV
jgi:hypothetical protein